jgi:hypothetical protein
MPDSRSEQKEMPISSLRLGFRLTRIGYGGNTPRPFHVASITMRQLSSICVELRQGCSGASYPGCSYARLINELLEAGP